MLIKDHLVAGGREPPVEIVGGADQRQVGESLREVAKMLHPRALRV
jgi:hypothetical protein